MSNNIEHNFIAEESLSHSEENSSSNHDFDIGAALSNNKFNICSDEARINLVKKHFKPDHLFDFPRKQLHGCNRSFNIKWLETYPFLVYSKFLDSVFCLPCTLFTDTSDSKNSFSKLPGFSKWQKIGEKLR